MGAGGVVVKQRILNVLIALDQFLFCLATLGHSSPDETLSAASYRWETEGKVQGKLLRPFIDLLFWFDKNHCYESWLAENEQKQLHFSYSKEGK